MGTWFQLPEKVASEEVKDRALGSRHGLKLSWASWWKCVNSSSRKNGCCIGWVSSLDLWTEIDMQSSIVATSPAKQAKCAVLWYLQSFTQNLHMALRVLKGSFLEHARVIMMGWVRKNRIEVNKHQMGRWLHRIDMRDWVRCDVDGHRPALSKIPQNKHASHSASHPTWAGKWKITVSVTSAQQFFISPDLGLLLASSTFLQCSVDGSGILYSLKSLEWVMESKDRF